MGNFWKIMLKLNFETRKGRERVNEVREGTEG